MNPIALIVLAAGKGKRMDSDLPKVLHPLAGAPLLWHALRAGAALQPARRIVVVGHGAEAVSAAAQEFDPEAVIVRQEAQLGTAHAVRQAAPALEGFAGDAVILYGDTPFLSEATLAALASARAGADLVLLGFEATDPTGYGRLVMEGDRLARIVEHKDASEAERAITLCNSGILCADAWLLLDLCSEVGKANAAGEYYLTDVAGIAAARGLRTGVVRCPEEESLGINSPAELAGAEAVFQRRARSKALAESARMPGPDTLISKGA